MDYDDRDLSGRAPRQRRRAESWSEDGDYGDELPRPRAAEQSQVERYTSYPDPATTDFYRRTGDTGVGDIPPVRSSRARNRWQASRETEGWRQDPDGGATYGRTSESVSYEDTAPDRPSWADRRHDTGSWRNVSDTASWRRGSRSEPDEDTGYRAYQPGGRYGSRTGPEPTTRRRPPDEGGGSWGRDAEEDTWNRRSGAGSWRRVTETRTWVSETGSWSTADEVSDVPAPRPAPSDDTGTWGGRAVREDTGSWDAPRPTRSERRRAERAATEQGSLDATEQPSRGTTEQPSRGTTERPSRGTTERPSRGTTEQPSRAAERPRHSQQSDWPDWGDPTMGPARTRGMRADTGGRADTGPPVPRSGNAPQLPPEAIQERPDRAQWLAGAPGTADTGTWRRRPEDANDADWRGPQAVTDTGTWRRGAQMDGPRTRRDRSATEDTGTRAGGYGFTRAEPDAPRPRYAGETGEVSRYPRRTETDTSSWQRTPDGVMWTGAPATGAAPAAGVYRASRPVRSWQDDTSAADRDWAAGQANTGGLTRPSYADAPPEERTPRREMSAVMRRRAAVEELDELEDAPPGGPLAAIGFTVFWYSVPVLLFTIFTLTQGAAERARAGATLLGAAPQFGISLAVSIVIAYLLRLVSGTWKTASVGLAAAVMGGGLATVLVSAISGQPIG
ncbi:hypothetical protein [Catenuloplanes indicus]|uniref:Uncharacterized protein n=1 Tax=Catenuloplanes indicus TaxID=137267 RepID=A0AAE3W0M1_9ACTN|nr:hypothetical protein [Catenuloplanes indicus]MDQ0367723.1 hypothetical protein [Catenuloplanes indicus]